MSTTDILRPIVLMQPVLTFFLVALLWIYYSRLGKPQIMRWWAWAWTADGICLAAEWIRVEIGGQWTLPQAGLAFVAVVAGLAQAPLLVIGGASLARGASPGPRARRLLIGLSLGAAVVVFGLAFRMRDHEIRFLARAALCGAAYFYCAGVLLRHWRKWGSRGAAVTALGSALYGVFFLSYAVYRVLMPQRSIQVWLGLSFAKVVCEVGITLGLVLLLLETAEAAEQRVRVVVQGVKAVVWERDPASDVVSFISQPVEEILGYPVERWLQEPEFWLSVVHPDDREQFIALSRKAILEGEDPEMEYRAIAADGRVVWLRNNIRAVRDADGRVRRLLGVLVDITERKRAAEEQRKLIALIENSTEFIAVASPEGQVFFVNPAGLRLVGLDGLEEARTKTIFDFFSREDPGKLPEGILPLVQRSEHWEGEAALRHCKTGLPVPVMAVCFPIKEGQAGRPITFACVARDITERKQLEEQLRQAQKMEAVGRLAGGVAHDFNNLLTAILGYSDLVLNEPRQGDSVRDSVLEIKKAGERAASLTQQLLAFSRRQMLQPKMLRLNHAVGEMDKMLRRLIGEDVDMAIIHEPGSGLVKADPGQIQQVIMNLAINARDAMPEGGRLTIRTAALRLDEESARAHAGVPAGRYVLLSVADSGCGMDEETKSRVFEPFFTTKGPGRGTGLGLSTVYGIVQQSGGHIRIESEIGKGSTFLIYLPRLEESGEPAPAHALRVSGQNGAETILLVEDDGAVRELLRAFLDRCGYTVIEAGNGEEAIRISDAHGGPIHLLVTDVVMPQMGGRQLAERLAAARPGIKVLYMSGYTDDESVRGAATGDGRAFIQKPFVPADVTLAIRGLLSAPMGPAAAGVARGDRVA